MATDILLDGMRFGYDRPQWVPADFIFTPKYVERTQVVVKRDGFAVFSTGFAGGSTCPAPLYFVFVWTHHGDTRIQVSKKVYDLLQVGDSIVVTYRKGRWSGCLEGKIGR